MSEHDPEVTPEQEARLRRLLAQARHGEPVPDDIAARLDRVLQQLGAEGVQEAEEAGPPAGRGVVDLTARRRRLVSGLLAAAAAVVVVGVGANQLIDVGSGSDSTASDAGSSADSAADASTESLADGDRRRRLDDSSGQSFSQDLPGPASGDDQLPAPQAYPDARGSLPGPVRLTEAGFAKQAIRYSTREGTLAAAGSPVPGEELSRSEAFVCEGADWGAGVLLPALYDGVPAVLAYRGVEGETQTVDLLRCGTGDVLRSTVLPVER